MYTIHLICVFSFFISIIKTDLTVMELAQQFMYRAEIHQTVTQDGYQLSVHRILPKGPGPKKSPVLLMHGLFASGVDYLVLGSGRALGFLLSAAGYDVWLGNLRGLPGSTGHVDRTINAENYWNFSLDEVSKYDLPAIVDLVLTKSGHRSLNYIGHSMGTTLIMMMLAEFPGYIKKISMVILLSPVVYMSNPDPILLIVRAVVPIAQELLGYLKIFDFPSNYELLRKTGATVVSTSKGLGFMKRSLDYIFGEDCHLSQLVLKDLFSHAPTPASTRLLLHYAQIIGTENFRKFDWGSRRNLRLYGSKRPPNYDLSKITTSVFLFKGSTDTLTSKEDIDKLGAVLPNSATFSIRARQFAHLGFVYSDIADEVLYKPILYILQNKTLPLELLDVCELQSVSKLPDIWKLSDICNVLDTCC